MINDDDVLSLKKIFNRDYTKGFLFNIDNNDLINGYRPNHMGVKVGKILGYDKAMTSYISSEIMIDTGIYVYDVTYNSPAYIAGIKKGDIILAIDDLEVDTLCELREILFSKNIGEKMRIRFFRNQEEKEVIVTVEENR